MDNQSQDRGGAEEEIVLGGGCFWCTEAVFQRLEGVRKVTSGYAGGDIAAPTYEQVVTGQTGHAEVIQVQFDPAQITLEQLLEVFWLAHDPTTLNRQGADVGAQYRSAIYYTHSAQEPIIRQSVQALQSSGRYPGSVVTEIAPLRRFYPAEEEHHDYFNRNRHAGYCQFVILPKLQRLNMR